MLVPLFLDFVLERLDDWAGALGVFSLELVVDLGGGGCAVGLQRFESA